MILVFDREGSLFTTLRELELGHPLWRVSDARRLENTNRIDLAIAAGYDEVPWDLLDRDEPPFDALVVTRRPVEDEALDAIGRGLVGYLDANAPRESLRRTILACLDGEPGYPRRMLGHWLHTQNSCVRAHCNVTRLTERQRQVLDLVAEGFADKEIAERLGIATATAQKHVTNILERLRVANRAAAAASVCRIVTRTATRAARATRPTLAALPA